MKELKVKLGDKVAEGAVVLTLEVQGAAAAARLQHPPRSPGFCQTGSSARAAPAALILPASFGGSADMDCDVLVLGGGPGGYSAAFRAADLGLKVIWSSATPPWAACA